MKRLLLLFTALLLVQMSYAAWHENIPQTIEQPDGKVINCFATGDEFYHWLHDADGYTIVLNPEDGFFYYGVRSGDQVIPSRYVVGKIDPSRVGLQKNARISEALYYERRAEYQRSLKSSNSAPSRGIVNSVCIYISFADDSVFSVKRSQYKSIWSSETSPSVGDFFSEISYKTLRINAHHFPVSADTVNVCYVDIFPRKYYLPRTNSNPDGYSDSEKGQREHAMLKRAIEFIQSQVPDEVNLDMNNDNTVDNISFVIRGSSSAWSDLLWPHAWGLSSYVVTLKGKRVRSYFLTMENGFGVGTFCHELGHVFGAPDLYHYTDTGAPNAVGGWCLMNSSANPPQSICGFLKYKYNKWIPELTEITESGSYTILPLSQPDRNLFKIKSPLSRSEYFVLEYRKREGRYESSIPGSGLLVYRINPGAGNGNAGGPPDEVYTYRPNGTKTVEGMLNSAPFGSTGRQEFSDKTNPNSFLWADGKTSKGGIDLSNIRIYPDSVTFDVKIDKMFPPTDLIFTPGVNYVDLDWEPCLNEGFLLYYIYKNGIRYDSTALSYYKDYTIQDGIAYSYYITGKYGGPNGGETVPTNTIAYTPMGIKSLPYEEDFEEAGHGWIVKGTVEGFRWGDTTLLGLPSENTTKFLAANSMAAGANTQCLDYAISPRFNLSGKSKVNLYFDYSLKRWQQLDHLKIFFRRTPYETWIQVIDLPASGFGVGFKWRKYSIEIPPDAYAAEAQIGFRYDDGNGLGYGSAIDNVFIREPAAGVEGNLLEANVSLYPNPAATEITVEVSGLPAGPVTYRLISNEGRTLTVVTRDNPVGAETMSLAGLPAGMYHIMIETAGQVIIRNLVKTE